MSKVRSMKKKNVEREVWNRVQRMSGHRVQRMSLTQSVKQKGKSNESKSELGFFKN